MVAHRLGWWLRLRTRLSIPDAQERLDRLQQGVFQAIRDHVEAIDPRQGTQHYTRWSGSLFIEGPFATPGSFPHGMAAKSLLYRLRDPRSPTPFIPDDGLHRDVQHLLMRADHDLSPRQRKLWLRCIDASLPWRDDQPRYSAHQHLAAAQRRLHR